MIWNSNSTSCRQKNSMNEKTTMQQQNKNWIPREREIEGGGGRCKKMHKTRSFKCDRRAQIRVV